MIYLGNIMVLGSMFRFVFHLHLIFVCNKDMMGVHFKNMDIQLFKWNLLNRLFCSTELPVHLC